MQQEITTAVAATLKALGVAEPHFVVERPGDEAHGDYATNAALTAAKGLGKSPRAVAEELVAQLSGTLPRVESITIAGPGFVNFTLKRAVFAEMLLQILQAPEEWGRSHSKANETVLIEYTSPNLFKPLHIGNLVGNIIGESFTRLFEYAGATVKRLNYPSDIGLTVAKGVWGLRSTGGDPSNIDALGEAYRTGNHAYENDAAAKAEIDAVNRSLYAGNDPELSDLRARGIATSRARLSELCEILGTHFDTEIFESEVSELGKEIVKSAVGSVFEESENAIVYKGEKVGLHTRVFVTSHGLPTYEAKDIGHFTLKEARYPDWTHSIIVTGNEQTEYFKVLFAAMKELFPTAANRILEHVPTGFLTLTTGKMSSRKGNVLTGESLLEELMEEASERTTKSHDPHVTQDIAVAALKYEILRHSTGSNIIFDKERALSFEGDSGPYLQYTHARIASVEEKAGAVSIAADVGNPPVAPYQVERLLMAFPEVIAAALAERAPQQVVTYATTLASAFNRFYGEEKIADPADPHAPYKLALARAVRHTLKNALWVLGIKAPEAM